MRNITMLQDQHLLISNDMTFPDYLMWKTWHFLLLYVNDMAFPDYDIPWLPNVNDMIVLTTLCE